MVVPLLYSSVFALLRDWQDIRIQVRQFPEDDARIKALIPIIDYLDKNGPLYFNSSTHADILRFLVQLKNDATAILIELAFSIESQVPEKLRTLTTACDPVRDLYKELDGPLDVAKLEAQAKEAPQKAIEFTVSYQCSINICCSNRAIPHIVSRI
jgi:hypothetical protein